MVRTLRYIVKHQTCHNPERDQLPFYVPGYAAGKAREMMILMLLFRI
jgi:hypothetical protein